MKDGKHLVIRSKKLLTERFEVSKYCYKIDINQGINTLREKFQAISIHENLVKQKYTLISKMVDDEMQKEGELHSKKLIGKLFNRKKKFITENYDSYVNKYKRRFLENIKSFDFSDQHINPYVTLSRKGSAKTINRKSASTGSNLIRKLKLLNLVEDEKNHIYLFDYNFSNVNIFNYINEIFHYKYLLIDNKLYLRNSNNIKTLSIE